MPQAMLTHYCQGCQKQESSYRWHGPSPCLWCHKFHLMLARSYPSPLPHLPAWHALAAHVRAHDRTGHPITPCDRRHDVQRLHSVGSICFASRSWNLVSDFAMLCGYVMPLYWSWPMLHMASVIMSQAPQHLAGTRVQLCLKSCGIRFKDLRVQQGRLMPGCRGLNVLQNPSARRPGAVAIRNRFREHSRWKDCCAQLAVVLESFSEVRISDLLAALRNANLTTCSGRNTYGNIRLCRCLVFMTHRRFLDSRVLL